MSKPLFTGQVDGCRQPLEWEKAFFRRYRCCSYHSKQAKVCTPRQPLRLSTEVARGDRWRCSNSAASPVDTGSIQIACAGNWCALPFTLNTLSTQSVAPSK